VSAPAPLVIKIGGSGIDDPAAAAPLWTAIARTHELLHGQLVLVHGGGRAVDRHLERLGFRTDRIDGLRVTPPDQAEEIAGVLAGQVNKALVGALRKARLDAVGLCLSDGNVLECRHHPNPLLGQVGLVTGGDGRLLRTLMDTGFLPVLCSIGLDEADGFLNVNADDAAAGVAQAIGARALILLTDVEGIRGHDGSRIESTDAAGIESLIRSGVISGGMIPKARAAAAAAARARSSAYIASYGRPEDLLRIVRGESAGTRVDPHMLAPASAPR
jgi:acetylglutamate kinase